MFMKTVIVPDVNALYQAVEELLTYGDGKPKNFDSGADGGREDDLCKSLLSLSRSERYRL
jgi:hypothetical protein